MGARPSESVSQDLVHQKCLDFVDFQVWPLQQQMDYRAWLSNFSKKDLPIAYHLLNAFMYFPQLFTNELFVSALQGIHTTEAWRRANPGNVFTTWPAFIDNIVLTYVTGEVPSPADSGYGFTRAARDYAKIGEAHIYYPHEALEIILSGAKRPLVFVDDFVGSGNQFRDTWHREYSVSGASHSFAEAQKSGLIPQAYYAPAICTSYGLGRLSRSCPGVTINPGNLLSEFYSVFHPSSLVWPQSLLLEGQQMVRNVSAALGFPCDKSEWGIEGFHGLGLALGFYHKTPDATLPIFRYDKGGWHPLVSNV